MSRCHRDDRCADSPKGGSRHCVAKAITLLILFTESLDVHFAVRIEEFLAALLPRRFEFGRCDVPVRPGFLGNGTQVLAEIFKSWPAKKPVADVDLINDKTGLEDTMEFNQPFSLPAVLGSETSAAEDENHWMLSLQFGELSPFRGVIGKFIIGEDNPWMLRRQSEAPVHVVPGGSPGPPSFENAASTHLDGSSSTAHRMRSCHQREIWFRSSRS